MKYNWDASTYDRISDVIESWGLEVIERINWKGNEIVLDAGCGSGRLTKISSTKIPNGKVFAVDLDSSMIKLANERLAKIPNVKLIQANICEIELQDRVDGFSNIEVFLEKKVVKFHDKEDYFLFIKTIVLRPYLEYLYNDSLKIRFAKAIAHEIETSFKELQWKLDYVRLNNHAKK